MGATVSRLLGHSDPDTSRLSAITVKYLLLQRLPLELVLQILHEALYLPTLTFTNSEPVEVASEGPLSAYPYLKTQPLPPRVYSIEIEVESHDQGWSSYRGDWGTKNNSWTWWEAFRLSENEAERDWEKEEGLRVATNVHASRLPKKEVMYWGKDEDFAKDLKKDDVIVLVAKAQYPGWRNHVKSARITVWMDI
ncbi:hypothetical protein BT69DRAFT_1337204 [Atractiella rhizophila]|nr:hypothetical protein BT69DRAFT_1337204 [Atractiella rhizophila]